MTIVHESTVTAAPAAPVNQPAQPVAAPAPADSALVTQKPAEAPAAPAAATETVPPANPAAVTLDGTTAPAVTIEAPAAAADGKVSYEPTGSAALDMSLKFLGENGYGPDHPAMKAAADGDFAMLKAELAAKGVKGAAEYLALGEQAYAAVKKGHDERAAADRAAIFGAVGGEENWKSIREWASKNADESEKAHINKTMQGGGLPAKAMAVYLAGLHAKAPGTTVNPAAVTVPGATSQPAAAVQMTRSVYLAEIGKLKAQFGGAIEGRPEYLALQNKRMAAITAGITG